MPKLPVVPGVETAREKTLKPFAFHGLDVADDGKDQIYTDCPFCGKPKFSISPQSGLCKCWVCGQGSDKGGMNPLSFLQHLWKQSDSQTTNDYAALQLSRGFLEKETPMLWGAVQSLTDLAWLLPGRDLKGHISQLYRWVGTPKRTLYPTPGFGHGLFLGPDSVTAANTLWIAEGPWDAMAFWETARQAKQTGEGLGVTANASNSILAGGAVIGVPGANSFKAEWAALAQDKDVILLFDSDHPRLHCKPCGKTYSSVLYTDCPQCKNALTGPPVAPAGFSGIKRVAGLLAGKAKSVRALLWGLDGYAPELPSGTDLRDILTKGKTAAERVKLLDTLLGKIGEIPGEQAAAPGSSGSGIDPLECTNWAELQVAWKAALAWRQSLDDSLAVCLAVCLSTMQKGSQLFLQLIGDAGSGKTEICDALLVSKHCFALEHLTGFHSGWKGENGEDYSLIGRINGKTLITPEGDVLMSSPKFLEIMSQQRRIFDGASGATFKNRKEDMRYENLRTPWVMAGTPALLSSNQSRLGDRFIRVIVEPPDEIGKRAILRKVAETALEAVLQTSNCAAGSITTEKKLIARRLTGGYINHLRDNAESLLARVHIPDQAALFDYCALLGDFVSHMRARPDSTTAEEKHETKEMPTRLTEQFVRLHVCLAVVTGGFAVNKDVMRRVRKVALDTAKGKTFDWVNTLYQKDAKDAAAGLELSGVDTTSLGILFTETDVQIRHYLRFLKKIKVVENFKSSASRDERRWRLTDKVKELWAGVMNP